MSADIGDTLAPNSDSITSAEFIGGARIVTITAARVLKGQERPVEIALSDFDRPYKPNVTMRRLLVAAWGPRSADYVGRRMELYRDEGVRFGKEPAPGIRISGLSHISEAVTVRLATGRNKSETFIAKPLPDTPAPASTVAPDKMTAALNAIGTATDASKLDAIEKHAASLGIGQTTEIQSALITKRGELEGLL